MSSARRRQLLVAAGVLLAAPLARAQQPERMKRIGVLIPYAERDAQTKAEVTAFREDLQKLGWTEGRNIRIDYRWAGGDIDRIRAFAKELVALQPDVIVARTTPVTAALLKETRSIPIVFAVVSGPIGDGFLASLARPGGNVTGFTNVESSMGGKWLELLKELVPRITRAAVLFNPQTAPGGGAYYLRTVSDAARSISIKVIATPVHGAGEIERAIATLAREPGGGLLVVPDATTFTHRKVIISQAARYSVPAIYSSRFLVAEGGLLSYGPDFVDVYRRAASYVDRILRGEKPSELPVQAPTKFELVINLKTAKALGFTVPRSLLLRADKVIQ